MERRSSGGRFLIENRSHWLPYLTVAVCLLMLPLALIGDRRRGEPRVFTAGKTGILTLRLPDGSRATLINGGTIEFRDDFVLRRRAWVFGQALLEVLQGPTLSLWTETAFISTTGGSFTVRASGRETTFVSVRTGTARLRALNDESDPAYRSVTIGAGQRGFAARLVGARVTAP
jgi:ferric-dicitrate binding protein FerR (iron transport regulator)